MAARLHHGDCLEIMRGLPDASVDAVIADPPYGTTDCKWDAVIPFAPMWGQLRRVAKPTAAIILFAAQPFTSALVMSNPRWFRQSLVWDKQQSTDPQLANVRPMRRHEDILIFGQRGPTYNPQMEEREKPLDMRNWKPSKDGALMRIRKGTNTRRTLSTQRFPSSILVFSSVAGDCNSARRVHPTQKPVDLLSYLVRTYTNPGETVLDFCMGSGTTGVACAQEGRDFIGIERDTSYFAIAERRIAAAQPPLFAEVAD